MEENKELERLREFEKRVREEGNKWAEYIHPHYGPCDGFEDGMCYECYKVIESMKNRIKELSDEKGDWQDVAELNSIPDFQLNTWKSALAVKDKKIEKLEKKLKASEKVIENLHNVCEHYSERLKRQQEEIKRLRGSLVYTHKDIDELEDILDGMANQYDNLIEEYYKNEGTPPPEEEE